MWKHPNSLPEERHAAVRSALSEEQRGGWPGVWQ